MKKNVIITISRQYRSGGKELGLKLAEYLDISYYDKELMGQIAAELHLSPEFFSDSNLDSRGLYSIGVPGLGLGGLTDLSVNAQMTQKARELIQGIAQRENAVIVGRAADGLLAEDTPHISVFVKSAMKDRVQAVMEKEKLPAFLARKRIREMDAQRRSCCEFAGRTGWGEEQTYDVVIDLSQISEQQALDLLASMYDDKLGYTSLKGGYVNQYRADPQ